MAGPTILLSAGEPSGDLHGAAVARALRARLPEARLFGLGGPRMAGAGVELLADPDRLAVMGFAEVVAHLPFFMRLLRTVRRELTERQTSLILPIDYPGFNMRLARTAHAAGIPVLYYIAPQVWAWHRGRARELARLADRVAVVLPFEEALFGEAGARASFVGHPLVDAARPDISREALCAALGLEPRRPILALFPGSRVQELKRHLPLFVAAAEHVRERRPDVQPVIAAAPALAPEAYDAVSPAPTLPSAIPSTIRRTRDTRALLRHARAALVKSGTGTLETALAGVPLVIVYRTHPLTFWLARRLVRVDHIGLANLVAGERVAPEYLQDQATAEALATAVLPLLDDGGERKAMVQGLARVRAALIPPEPRSISAADRVAAIATELLDART